MHPPAPRPPRTVSAFLPAPRFLSSLVLRLLACLAFAGAVLAPRGAAAQFFDAGTTTTTNFDASDFFIGVQANPTDNLSDFDVARFFNKARCLCNQPVFIYVTLVSSGFAKRSAVQATTSPSGSLEVWIGTGCDADLTLRGLQCQRIGSELLAQFLMDGHFTAQTDMQTMSAYVNPGAPDSSVFGPNTSCTAPIESFPQNIYVLVTPTGTAGQYQPSVTRSVNVVLEPPPQPDPNSVNVQGGDQALVVNWQKLDTAVYTNLLGYQILCNRGGDLQVFNTGAFTPGFTSVGSLQLSGLACGGAPPEVGITGLDPGFVCSPMLTTSASSFRVKILQNDIVYGVSVVAVDNSGNASTSDIFYGTPIKTKSFYDVYRDGNTGSSQDLPGGATGGFCALASPRPGRASAFAAVALGALGIALAAARRRRRR